jgi:hypothetical protein
LVAGKAQFLKKEAKSIVDTKEYASAVVQRQFMMNTKYYIYIVPKDESEKPLLVSVKKNQKSILSVLKDKEDLLLKYIDDKGLDLKKEADIVKLISYYNTI